AGLVTDQRCAVEVGQPDRVLRVGGDRHERDERITADLPDRESGSELGERPETPLAPPARP
ncbi:MAG: hypothetical protein ABI429_00565, partial [Jatrophihabitantaceae bacterium]